MSWHQQHIKLKAQPRGFHLITDEILSALPHIKQTKIGLLHLFLRHTSASLAINENAAPDVRTDLETHFNKLAPEYEQYLHTEEGPDDMPAHIKSTLIGCSLTIPITEGALNLGIWQGIYLCEHRNHATSRTLITTIHGTTT